jgi:glucuronoarabinoxylan endo-1,4-beta-xylanase
MAILRRWRDQGLEMPFYSIANEPAAQSSGAMSPQYFLAVTKLLGAKLRAEGFKTKIVIPDDITPNDAYDRAVVVLADPDARQYVGAIAYHVYGGLAARDKIKALGEQYSIPIWMTEYALATPFEWADLIHEEIADFGASAVDMQWGFFGQWESTNSHLITILNDGGSFQGWRRTKSFYTTGQFSRFVRPGAQRVEASSVSGVKVTAFKQGDEIVLVAITPAGATPKAVSFSLGGGPCTAQVSVVRTSGTEDWAALPSTQVAGRRFQATLAPGSVTTFVVK